MDGRYYNLPPGDGTSAGAERGGSPPGPPGSATGPGPANSCFVCGPDNPIGLHLHFRLDDDGRCVADFSPTEHHVGYPGVVHGGIIYSALDDSMANWLYLRGARAYTARSSVRYRATVAPGEPLRLEGRAVGRRGRVVEMAGVASRASDGELMAEATATFVVVEGRDRVGFSLKPGDPA